MLPNEPWRFSIADIKKCEGKWVDVIKRPDGSRERVLVRINRLDTRRLEEIELLTTSSVVHPNSVICWRLSTIQAMTDYGT